MNGMRKRYNIIFAIAITLVLQSNISQSAVLPGFWDYIDLPYVTDLIRQYIGLDNRGQWDLEQIMQKFNELEEAYNSACNRVQYRYEQWYAVIDKLHPGDVKELCFKKLKEIRDMRLSELRN